MRLKMILCLTTAALLYTLYSCGGESRMKSGEELSNIHCSSCHAYPKPDLLNKQSWSEYILPRMGGMLGMVVDQELDESVYTNQASMSTEEWEAIVKFYIESSPKELAVPLEKQVDSTLANFELIIPDLKFSPPSTTLIHFSDQNGLFFASTHEEILGKLGSSLKLEQAAKVGHGAVHLEEFMNFYLITVMGSFSPSDSKMGSIVQVPKDGKSDFKVILDSLNRPVHAAYADLDKNGRQDILVSEYGKWEGGLNLYLNEGNSGFKEFVISDLMGPIKSEVVDLDGDGLQDIVALFGQGNEGIYAFYNEGGLNFRMEELVKLSPSHGSSYFDLFDYDSDGDLDIIYTAGDNADFPPLLKPYHGVYIYINKGNGVFKEDFFYPMNGAYKAIPFDFDKDGDLDIAAIAFFPDWEEEIGLGFQYLENQEGNYKASTFEGSDLGRWITMDIGDYDDDGDTDIFLGSLAFEVIGRRDLTNKWSKNGIPFIVLSNQLIEVQNTK